MLRADDDRPPAGLTCYAVTSELTSPQWARAFAKGCARDDVAVTEGEELLPGDVAMFGSPRRWDQLQRAIAEGRTWYYGDHAYFGRREYYRITRGRYQLEDLAGEGDAERFERLGVRIRSSWRKHGRYILLCPNSDAYFRLHGMTAQGWIDETVRQLRAHTTREIRVRFKNSPSTLDFDVKYAWAVVVHTSVCGVHAALEGVPCFATAPCASRAFGTDDLSAIESPVRPDNRYELACVLAANQWTLHEMARGEAWRHLNEHSTAMARVDAAR